MAVRVLPRVLAATLGAGLGIAALSFGSSPAAAHNTLRSTQPAAGSTVATVPATVRLTFDEEVLRLGAGVTVTGPDGQVQTGRPVLEGTTVRQRVRDDAPPGRYTVAWRVTSADGHPINGNFRFTAEAARANTSTSPAIGSTARPSATTAADADATSSSGSSTPWAGIAVGALAGAVGGTAIVLRQRRLARDR